MTTVAAFAALGLTAGYGTIVLAQQQGSQDVIGTPADNEGIFVDGKTFQIARGKAKGDPSAQIAKLGAKEVGPGAIVFRYDGKLYMVEGQPEAAPQAMKNFQDDWSVSYMKNMKDFQDNWSVSFIKDFQDNWNTSYMKGEKRALRPGLEELPGQLEYLVYEELPGQLEHFLHEELPGQLEHLLHEELPGQLEHFLHEGLPG
jgi:hypothetical protein